NAEIANRRIEHDLLIAAELQKRTMPVLPPSAEGVTVGGFVHPARYVGGDFYEFSEYDSRYLLAGVGDISGKGIPAAMFMSSVRNVLRAESSHSRAPEVIFAKGNRQIFRDSMSGMFCTCFYCLLDRQERTIRYSSAGHNAQLFYCAADDAFSELSKTGRALGIFASSPYASCSIGYAPGDILILFTDGIFEQDADCELDIEQLQTLIRRNRNLPASGIASLIRGLVEQNAIVRDPVDDSTILVIRFE
ncbi:MAG: PP2C family protein-serine/threonine phosphatase, partial [Spirochaetota bacterium]